MESADEELLDNVTDESGNSYMIQRMGVDNGQLLSTEILQTPNGLVVDIGGDFIPVNYTSEDLLTQNITEEDRNLAAALVAVQFNQQQKQQQTQSDGSVMNTTLPSLMTTLDGSKVQIGENQVLVQDKQTGFFQIVEADELYKQYDDNTETLQLIKTEGEILSDGDTQQQKPVKKSLPHKKRISKKLKKNEKTTTTVTQVAKCTFCEQLFTLKEINEHQSICQNNISNNVTTNTFACQICNTSFGDQLGFFEHLKKHYEPTQSQEICIENEQCNELIQQGDNEEEELGHEEEEEEGENEDLPATITILKSDDDMLQHQIIKLGQKQTLLSSILQLTCLECNRTFRKQRNYELHMRNVHGGKQVLTGFSTTEDLMAGIDVNAHTEVTEIEEDNKEWYREEELHATEEDLKELEAKEHVCQYCNQQFLERESLITHLLTCTSYENEEKEKEEVTKKGRPKNKTKADLECDLCNRKFSHRNSLVYHMRSHTEDRPYQCDQCGKSFFAASALKVHLRLHSGEKPYRCEFCGRHFRQWGDLKYHCISIHSDEKQYQCEYCGKEFARKYSLIVHRRIHTGEKNYRCEFCGKTFRASSYLQNHRRIHTGEKPHGCEVCGKRFRVRSDMKRHLRTHTRRRVTRMNHHTEEMKIEEMEVAEMPQESEDTNESIVMLKEENDTAVQSLQYEQDGGLESIREANALYVHMPILIT